MKCKIIASIMVLLALMMCGCVDEQDEIDAEQETYDAVQSLLEEEDGVNEEVIEVYNASLDKCDKNILNKTIKLYENGEKIEVLQTRNEGLKINNNIYNHNHMIVIIPDKMKPRVNVVPCKACGNDQSILIGDNPVKCKNVSEVLIFVDYQTALDLHFSGYYCPHIYYNQGEGQYYRFEIPTDFNVVTSKLINEDFKQQEP